MSGKSEFIFVSGRVSGHSKDFRPGGQAARGSGSRSDLRERDTGLKPTPTGRSSSGASAAALRFVGSVMMNNSLDRTLGNSTVPGGALCRSSAWGWGGGSSACRELRPEALQFRCGGRRAASWGVALIFLFRRQAHGKGLDTLLSSFFLKLLFKGAFPHFGRCGGGGSAALGLSVFWVALREGPAACTPSLCWAGPPGAPTAGGGRPPPRGGEAPPTSGPVGRRSLAGAQRPRVWTPTVVAPGCLAGVPREVLGSPVHAVGSGRCCARSSRVDVTLRPPEDGSPRMFLRLCYPGRSPAGCRRCPRDHSFMSDPVPEPSLSAGAVTRTLTSSSRSDCPCSSAPSPPHPGPPTPSSRQRRFVQQFRPSCRSAVPQAPLAPALRSATSPRPGPFPGRAP